MAGQRGYQIVDEFTGRICGAKARRPGLDALMQDARRGRFDVVLVWASDMIARSVKHFLDLLDEFSRLNIEYVSFRESIDTGGPLGRAIVIIIGAIAELEPGTLHFQASTDTYEPIPHVMGPATIPACHRKN